MKQTPVIFQTNQFTIKAYKVITYPHEVYIAENVNIKPKALHHILKHVNDAMKDYNISELYRPTIVIADELIMGNRAGIYNAVDNVVYFQAIIGHRNNDFINIEFGEVEYHELWHVKQAERYINRGNKITNETKKDYINELRRLCKEIIDKSGITNDNVSEISAYAEESMSFGFYDEIEAELMVNHYFKKRGKR